MGIVKVLTVLLDVSIRYFNGILICTSFYLYTHTHTHIYIYTHTYIHTYIHAYMHTYTHTHTHTHTHTCCFLWFTGTFHRRNGFYTVQAVGAIALHPTPKLSPHRRLVHFYFPSKKLTLYDLQAVLNYGDTENVLINHLLLVIPMLYPCHYTNLCPHKPHKHAHTHTHTHTHIYTYIYIYIYTHTYIHTSIFI